MHAETISRAVTAGGGLDEAEAGPGEARDLLWSSRVLLDRSTVSTLSVLLDTGLVLRQLADARVGDGGDDGGAFPVAAVVKLSSC